MPRQGTSQAVIVAGLPLVHTRQLLPLDSQGKLVGEGSADQQIEQGAVEPRRRAEEIPDRAWTSWCG